MHIWLIHDLYMIKIGCLCKNMKVYSQHKRFKFRIHIYIYMFVYISLYAYILYICICISLKGVWLLRVRATSARDNQRWCNLAQALESSWLRKHNQTYMCAYTYNHKLSLGWLWHKTAIHLNKVWPAMPCMVHHVFIVFRLMRWI